MRIGALAALLCSGYALAASEARLIDAIKDQNTKAVDALLAGHADVNAKQPDGSTPLAWAVYLDFPDLADRLMKAGAEVNTTADYGETPLTLACSNGNGALVKKLVDAGADVKAARWDGETALMLAARSGSVEAVKALLARGADVNAAESRRGQNALMWASAAGQGPVVDVLIQAGAEIKKTTKAGFTPLVFAAQKGDAHAVSSLIVAGVEPNYTLPNGMSVLEVAVSGGKTDAASVLITKGADVNAADRQGNTSLHLAAQLGNLELTKQLLAKGANPNARTAKSQFTGPRQGGGFFRLPPGENTPLLMAAKANHEDVMRALVAGGADPKLKPQDGATLLIEAAGSGHVGVVKYAYELNPDIKGVTTSGMDPVHAAVTGTGQLATQQEICEVVQFLADKGADLDNKDARGKTAIDIADVLPLDKVVELLTSLIIKSGHTPQSLTKR